MAIGRSRNVRQIDFWPGYVDALSSLSISVIFMVLVFVLAQMFLSNTLSGRNDALSRLNRQIDELSKMLDLERGTTADLRLTVTQFAAELQNAQAEREVLRANLANLTGERGRLVSEREALDRKLAQVEAQLTAANADAARARGQAEDATKLVAADRENVTLQLAQIESLNRDLAALRTVRAELEARVAELAKIDAERLALRDRTKELEARIATDAERTALAQQDLAARDVRLAELLAQVDATKLALGNEQQVSTEAQRQLALLNAQLNELRRQMAALNEALQAQEAKNVAADVQIADLGQRLNLALATRVQDLTRYRSEFFGRLREVLGDRQDVRVVGDRFVFQSEVLFQSAQATIEDGGEQSLLTLANAVKEIAASIPKDIDWVIRVDGHTDLRPIATPQFPSNWELSSARAISVVRFLIEQGIPAERLVAAGFGEFRPLDPARTDDAFRRNRRIEFKLTER
ncbi:MAG: peptidoglycan -binding protein [Alphaproteobacteria bacterium]|nr:peptidoglycan -binding protein [Alphaproteobacteria bacterium]